MKLTEAELARLDDIIGEAIGFAFDHGRHDEEDDGFAREGFAELLRLARIGQEAERLIASGYDGPMMGDAVVPLMTAVRNGETNDQP